jgi:hypothetical protein
VAGNDRRSLYQFQDGKLRKIAESHHHLMQEVDRSLGESMRVQRELANLAGRSMARRQRRDAGEELITLAQQMELFRSDHSAGFADPGYHAKHRGAGKRPIKRHRDPAIATAAELLGRSEMLRLIASQEQRAVIERASEILASTNLVSKRDLAVLETLDVVGSKRAAAALCELLHGEVEMVSAMQAWIDALASGGATVSWSLATALPALLAPHEHVCVRESVFRMQARWMAPRLPMHKRPSGRAYERFLSMALRIRDELDAGGLRPSDLFDVHDFVWLTLRPAARKRMTAKPKAANDDAAVVAESVAEVA